MYLKKNIFIPILYVIFLSQTWAGPGSTTEDLMSKLNSSSAGSTLPEPAFAPQPEPVIALPLPGDLPLAAAAPPPLEDPIVDSCPASEMIETAHENDLPFGRPWVVFNDPEKLSDAFNFEKTLNQIVNSASSSSTTAAELVGSLVDSLGLESAANPESGLITPIDPRELEQEINPQAAVDEWIPVGVFNRLDTAPLNGDHCGEYRIVYANPSNPIDPTLQAGAGRFFTIFEAAIPNPQPSEGIQGCQPIAEFWASLADPALTDEQRVVRLEQFFYQGIEAESSGQTISIEPAVSFSHYTGGLGQVRTNQFFDFRWQLREFKTTQDGSGNVKFAVETVKNNALTEFYDLTSEFPNNQQLFDNLSDEFQNIFVSTLMDELTSTDGNAQDESALINGISMVVPNKFNEFQSDSQDSSDDITRNTGITLQGRIDDRLVEINTPPQIPTITKEHILARAEAMSCGGCHQFANGIEIGTLEDGSPVNWPNSGTFVHINEGGNLSPALNDVFLPAREAVLKGFVCTVDDGNDECIEQTQDLTEDTPIVEASGQLSSFFSAWKAFDRETSFDSLWASAVGETPAWISYEWDTPREISQYSITYADQVTTSFAPKVWELQGWNGSDWITVDSRSDETDWGASQTRTYDVDNPGSFNKYRLNFTDDNFNSNGIALIVIGDISLQKCD